MTHDIDHDYPAPARSTGRAAPDRPTTSRHGPVAQLLIAWSPLSVILLAYAAAGWISAPLERGDGAVTNRLGFGVHVAEPATADRRLFGSVPSVWLQERLVDGSAHWYDAIAALVYVTHFVSIPLITALVWFWMRERFAAWLAGVLVFTTLGVSGYVVYPATPPWLASQQGDIARVDRVSNLGWDFLHLDWVGTLIATGQGGSNPVAAMPSLHAGAALMIALFLWPAVSAAGRMALLTYAMLMALTLVYSGEHYVVDVIGGWVTATIAVAAGRTLHRHRPSRLAP